MSEERCKHCGRPLAGLEIYESCACLASRGMIRVKVDELRFRRGGSSGCLILHKDKVIKRGPYKEMFNLFMDITEDNPESTVAVKYEEETTCPTGPKNK